VDVVILRTTIFLLIISAIMVLSGCSGGSDTVLPGNDPCIPLAYNSLPAGVTDYLTDGTPSAGMGALGVFQLEINPSDKSADLISLRQSALTDVLEVVDITNFLQLAPCSDCVKVKSVSLDADGNLVVSIGIKHPFGAGEPIKPISGKNRGDLHVFNVEGIVVSNAPGTSFMGLGQAVAGFELVNADGLTGYLDDVLDEIYPTDATVHPYITHFDDYSVGNFDAGNPMGFESVTDPPPSGNLVMAMGCEYDYQDYVFNLSGEPVSFIYAIGCTYAVSSASKMDRFTPEYRIPQHNKKSASEVSLHIITNDLAGEDTLSTAEIEIHVVDISHGVAVGESLNEMFADSSVDDIFIDIPDVMTDMLILDGNNPVSGTGHEPSDPLVYQGTITNTAGVTEGTYAGLIKVTDTYAPALNTNPLIYGMDGIERVDPIQNPLEGLFAISEFATYQFFTIYVMAGNDPPVAVLETDPDPAVITQYMTIDLDATLSSDSDGTIDLYEYDFDWDDVPANFTADDSNTTGLITSPSYDTEGFYTIGLRVTDDDLAVGYDSVVLEVEAGCVIFVDDDNTTGPWDGSVAHPYQYVQDGVDAAVDDCIVWIKPGTYNEDLGGANSSGLAEVTINSILNLTLHGEGMPVISLHTYLGTGRAAVHAYDCHGLTIEGIEFDPGYAYQSAVWLVNCNNVNILDCRVSPAPQYGFLEFFRGSGCSDLVIRNNDCDDMISYSTYSNLMVISSCPNALVTLNTCRRLRHGGYNMHQTGMSYIYLHSSTDSEISKNIFGEYNRACPSNNYVQLQGIYLYNSNNVVVRNNLIYDLSFRNQSGNDSRDWAIIANNCGNVEIFNNTIDSFGINASGTGTTYGIWFQGSSTATGVYNNIISNLESTTSGTCYGVYGTSAFTQDYSDVWNLTGGTIARYAGSASEGANGIDSDPLFTDPAAYDYTLQSGSPCAGTGMNGDDMGCYGGSDPLP
jgi:hypothetical protein